jgi:prolyl oligopeptidase PreP (S9A serine peptidase family)
MIHYFRDENLLAGRLISYSKSSYREKNPDNEVYFNANIFVLGEGKVWYGDIDVTKDREKLERIASASGNDLFILREFDGRFENEDLKDPEIITKSVCKITK